MEKRERIMKVFHDLQTETEYLQKQCDHEIVVILHKDKFEAECAFCGKKYYHKNEIPFHVTIIHMEEDVYSTLLDEQKMFLVRKELWECKIKYRAVSTKEWGVLIEDAIQNQKKLYE